MMIVATACPTFSTGGVWRSRVLWSANTRRPAGLLDLVAELIGVETLVGGKQARVVGRICRLGGVIGAGHGIAFLVIHSLKAFVTRSGSVLPHETDVAANLEVLIRST
jgi:hypothetical protein